MHKIKAAIFVFAILTGVTSEAPRGSRLEGMIPENRHPDAAESRGIPKTASEFSERVREVDEYLRGFLKTSVVPGISVAMGVGDEFTQLRGYGFLDLDADVRRYVPEFPDKGAPITVRDLAYHRSGIRHYREDEALSHRHYESVLEALKVFADDPLVAKPGTAFSYSPYGYTLLSAAMERAAGQPFPALMREKILKPFEMTQTELETGERPLSDQATGYEAGDDGKPKVAPKTDLSVKWAGGGFVSTAGDLMKFARALLDGQSLREETMDLLWTPQPGREAAKATLGLGWQVTRTPNGKRLLMTGGNAIGGTTVMFIVPEEKIVLAFMTNMGNAPIRGVPAKILGILLGEDGALRHAHRSVRALSHSSPSQRLWNSSLRRVLHQHDLSVP